MTSTLLGPSPFDEDIFTPSLESPNEMLVMDKRDYFVLAMEHKCYLHKGWILNAFTYVEKMDGSKADWPLALTRHENGSLTFVHEGKTVTLEDTYVNGAPFRLMEAAFLRKDELPNAYEDVHTTYGNILYNAIVLCYSMGGKVPFITGTTTIRQIESKYLERRVVSSDQLPETMDYVRDPKSPISVRELKRFNEAIRFTEGLASICVPAASYKAMTVDPSVIKRRNELYKQYSAQLQDPLIQAKIDSELIAMEKQIMKGDPAERFYAVSEKKFYNVIRKRLFLTIGREDGFGKEGRYIKTSLNEGWDYKNLPEMNNASRNGSYSRGFLTALGGVEVKAANQICQNTVVAEEDCGTKLGLRMYLDSTIAPNFISSSIIEENGKVVELTDENLANYTDKHVTMRTVGYCKTEGQNICAVCVGKRIASTPNAVAAYVADVGSTFVGMLMSAMHGKALVTNPIFYRAALT